MSVTQPPAQRRTRRGQLPGHEKAVEQRVKRGGIDRSDCSLLDELVEFELHHLEEDACGARRAALHQARGSNQLRPEPRGTDVELSGSNQLVEEGDEAVHTLRQREYGDDFGMGRGRIVIGDAHGDSQWTYDLAGKQREKDAFKSELVELRD